MLVARVGHVGLTNGACEHYQEGVCDKFVVVDYDLNDSSLRASLRELQFVCLLGKKRYLICKDQPGLCHREYKGGWFTRKPIDEYIDQSENKRLVDGGVTCQSEARGAGLSP